MTLLIEIETNIKICAENIINIANESEATIKENQVTVDSMNNLENLVQTLTTGLTSSKGQENGYMDQMTTAKKLESDASAEIEQCKIKITHLYKDLKEAEPRARAAQKGNSTLQNELDHHKTLLSTIIEEMANISHNQEQENALKIAEAAKSSELNLISHEIEKLERSQYGLNFEYSDPSPNFDRRQVRGLVMQLIDISNENSGSTTALEICAGARLRNVIIYL